MIFQESETIEFKQQVVEDVKKEIIAFANCKGGTLYIGVKDDGTIIGLKNPDASALQISNMIRDAINPDISLFLHYETIYIQDKYILKIDIQSGTSKPYYLAKKGMRPEGVYVRQGYSSVCATDFVIRKMIKETDKEHYENMRSLKQELTFQCAQKEFKMRHMNFNPPQYRTLKLMNHENLYTNLAFLLSDQNKSSIKVAVFQDEDENTFKDRKEFSGSLFKQMNEVYNFLEFINQTHSTIEGLYRKDIKDYPQQALRESLLNLIVHRDYSVQASSFIRIYSNRIEFISIGGLLPQVELEDILLGLSVCRNPDLANIFYRLQLIEAYGTGIQKIMDAYKNSNKKPFIQTTKNAFKITIYNQNRSIHDSLYKPISNESKVMEYVNEYGQITRKQAQTLLQVSESSATRILRKLIQDQQLYSQGNARNTHYVKIK